MSTNSTSNSTAPGQCRSYPTVVYTSITLSGVYMGFALVLSILTTNAAIAKAFERRSRFWYLFAFGSVFDLLKNVMIIVYLPNMSIFCGNPWTEMGSHFFNGVFTLMANLIPMTARIWRFFLTKIDQRSLIKKVIIAIVVALYLLSLINIILKFVYVGPKFTSNDPKYVRSITEPFWVSTQIPRFILSCALILSFLAEVMFVRNFLSKPLLRAVRRKDPNIQASGIRQGIMLFALMTSTNPAFFTYRWLLNFATMVVLSFDFWSSERIISTYIPMLMKSGKNWDTNYPSDSKGKPSDNTLSSSTSKGASLTIAELGNQGTNTSAGQSEPTLEATTGEGSDFAKSDGTSKVGSGASLV
ncbi:hypothetical protein HK102_000742 [Quaeritorhiza haematococci]|nr:hypothetical protein HK102_000742 [Quaeritorhiza haematococci]